MRIVGHLQVLALCTSLLLVVPAALAAPDSPENSAAETQLEAASAPTARVDDPGHIRLFAGLAASITNPFQDGSNTPGFGLGGQWDIGKWLGVWGMFSYQPSESLTDTGWDWGEPVLEYTLWSMAATVGAVARLNVAALAGRPKDWIGRVLTSFEIAAGPLVGVAAYHQTLRGEAERAAWVPIAGIQLEMGIWFTQWLGLRFAGDFGWSLNKPLGDGAKGVLRNEVFFGPVFRF